MQVTPGRPGSAPVPPAAASRPCGFRHPARHVGVRPDHVPAHRGRGAHAVVEGDHARVGHTRERPPRAPARPGLQGTGRVLERVRRSTGRCRARHQEHEARPSNERAWSGSAWRARGLDRPGDARGGDRRPREPRRRAQLASARPTPGAGAQPRTRTRAQAPLAHLHAARPSRSAGVSSTSGSLTRSPFDADAMLVDLAPALLVRGDEADEVQHLRAAGSGRRTERRRGEHLLGDLGRCRVRLEHPVELGLGVSPASVPWYRSTIVRASRRLASTGLSRPLAEPATGRRPGRGASPVVSVNHRGMRASGMLMTLPNCSAAGSAIPT